jgi:hypothetical protein
MVSSIGISMKPLCILVYAGAWLALRMTRQIDSFRTGEVLCLVMPFQTGVASAVDEYEFHINIFFHLLPDPPPQGGGRWGYLRGAKPLLNSPSSIENIFFYGGFAPLQLPSYYLKGASPLLNSPSSIENSLFYGGFAPLKLPGDEVFIFVKERFLH